MNREPGTKKEIKLTSFEEDWQKLRAMKRGDVSFNKDIMDELIRRIKESPEFTEDMEPELHT